MSGNLLLSAVSVLVVSAALVDDPILTEGCTLREHTRLVRCLDVAPDGSVATGGQDRLLCMWSERGELVHRVDLRPGGG